MKLMKKITMLLLCICLTVPCFSMISHAEVDGIRFNDPSTKVGETVKVSVNMQSNAAVENINITFSYDTTYLKFIDGKNFTETAPGTVVYDYKINASSLSEKIFFSMNFQALKVGTTTVTISAHNITSNPAVAWKQGNAKVTIAAGEEGIESITPETPGTPETPETPEIPETPAQEIKISNTTTITLIEDVSSVILPERFADATVTMDGTEYAAWRDTVNTDYYILYASNSNGETGLYRYDVAENTYQRFEIVEEEKEEGFLVFLGDYTEYVVVGVGVLLLLFVILIIVLSVKLYNRNAELDELYDEYGIDLEEEEDEQPVKKEVKKEAKREEKKEILLEEEEDPEIEVEFFVQDVKKTMDTVFFEKVEEQPTMQMNVKEEGKVSSKEALFDDDLDLDFEIDFIDLEN